MIFFLSMNSEGYLSRNIYIYKASCDFYIMLSHNYKLYIKFWLYLLTICELYVKYKLS